MLIDPADLPPGVGAFLANDCRFSADVVSQCLIELAAEGVVRLDPQPGGPPLVSLAESGPRSGRALLPFEDVILPRIGERARLAPVPLTVVLGDDGDEFKQWKKQLTEALEAQAKQGGLAKVKFGRKAWLISLSLAGCCLIVGLVDYLRPSGGPGLLLPAAYGAGFSLCLLAPARRLRPTAAGAAAAAWWRRDGGLDRLGGTGQPGQPVSDRIEAVEDVRLANFTLPVNHVWSSVGGHWHPVKVGVALTQTTWGTTRTLAGLISTVIVAVAFFGIGGLIADSQGHPLAKFAGLVPLALGAIVVLGSWLPTYSRRKKLPESVTVTGQLVKSWIIPGGDWPDGYAFSVDDGEAPVARAIVLNKTQHDQLQLRVGDTVRVSYSMRTGQVHDIERFVDVSPL